MPIRKTNRRAQAERELREKAEIDVLLLQRELDRRTEQTPHYIAQTLCNGIGGVVAVMWFGLDAVSARCVMPHGPKVAIP